jgi:hypothetical protein
VRCNAFRREARDGLFIRINRFDSPSGRFRFSVDVSVADTDT